MIKAEDIRIGDLVRVCRNGWFPEGSVCIVTQINSERSYKENKGAITLSYVDGTDDGPWGVWCSHIEGIPLSPAVLEKNGFDSKVPRKSYIKYIDDSTTIIRRYLYIERKRRGWEVFIKIKGFSDSVMIRQIQYVHEFQHILWAMGIDASLEI
jgi:hypothetical protein